MSEFELDWKRLYRSLYQLQDIVHNDVLARLSIQSAALIQVGVHRAKDWVLSTGQIRRVEESKLYSTFSGEKISLLVRHEQLFAELLELDWVVVVNEFYRCVNDLLTASETLLENNPGEFSYDLTGIYQRVLDNPKYQLDDCAKRICAICGTSRLYTHYINLLAKEFGNATIFCTDFKELLAEQLEESERVVQYLNQMIAANRHVQFPDGLYPREAVAGFLGFYGLDGRTWIGDYKFDRERTGLNFSDTKRPPPTQPMTKGTAPQYSLKHCHRHGPLWEGATEYSFVQRPQGQTRKPY